MYPKAACSSDTDGDGTYNHLDLDSEGDSCSDGVEAGNTDVADNDISTYNTGTDANNNGLLDEFEDGTTGNINYTSSYDPIALSSSMNACADTDGDGIGDLIDIDDDNDGVLDINEKQCVVSSDTIPEDLTWHGTAAANMSAPTATTLSVSGAAWANAYSDQTWGLPMSVTGTVTSVSNGMIGILPASGTETSSWDDGGYKFQFDASNGMYVRHGSTTPGWQAPSIVGTTFELNIDASGTMTYTHNGSVVYTGTVPVTDYKLTIARGAFEVDNFVVSGVSQVSDPNFCEDIDTDGDGTPDHLDLDSEGDSCSDSVEAGNTAIANNDTTTYNTGTDANNNGLLDQFEDGTTGNINYSSSYDPVALSDNLNMCADTDGDGISDLDDIDDDNDGVLDADESPSCFYTAEEASEIVSVSSALTSYSSYVPANTIDDNASTLNAFNPSQNWVDQELYKLEANAALPITGVTLDLVNWAISNGASNTFKLQGSVDDSSWVDLSSAVASTASSGSFTVSNTLQPTGSYKYYRLIGVAGTSYYGGVTEIRLDTGSSYQASLYPKAACSSDTDGDGTYNHLDLDSDGDSCSDGVGAGNTLVGDNDTTNFNTGTDANNNGLLDEFEDGTTGNINYTSTYDPIALSSSLNACADTDGDGVGDLIDLDDDNDGVLDTVEQVSCGLDTEHHTTFDTPRLFTSETVDGSNLNNYYPDVSPWYAWHNNPGTRDSSSEPSYLYFNDPAQRAGVAFLALYKETVSVPPLTDLKLFFKLSHDGSLIQVLVDGVSISGDPRAMSSSSEYFQWDDYSFDFRSSASGEAEVEIRVYNYTGAGHTYGTGGSGDGAIDDIKVLSNCFSDLDTDGDGTPNHLDLDSDGDSCPDAYESSVIGTLLSGDLVNSGGTTTSPNAIAEGGYGANGFADGVETSAESGVYNGTYTYADALDDGVNNCPVLTPANITGSIWLDTDKDGVVDTGESGLGGVTVYLCAASETTCDASTALSTMVTDANGDYVFANVSPGDYQVQVDPAELSSGELSGLTETLGNASGNSGTLSVSGSTVQADLGYVPATNTAVVDGTVFSDADGDGVQDSDEVGLSGVTVQLCPASDPTCASSTPISTTTKADGSYLFSGVASGEYVALVDQSTVPSGYSNTTPTTTTPFNVAANDVVSDVDFGFESSSTYSVTDAIFDDADGDGVRDAGEGGLGGVTVNLVDCGADGVCGNSDDGGVIATTTTNPDGSFSFSGLEDGNYQVQISDNQGKLTGYDETTSTGGTMPLTINGGDVDNSSSPSFGYNQPGTIKGTVFSDVDGDGVPDEGESGLGGVTVYICSTPYSGTCDSSNPNFVGQTTTNPDGSYEVTGVAPGTYEVVLPNPPAGTSTGSPNVTLPAGGSATANLGFTNAGLDDVSGNVFNDLNKDGTRQADGLDGDAGTTEDNETGIAGVTVVLTDCGADNDCHTTQDNNVVATTTTDANGDYVFADVPDGDYAVRVTDTDNVLDGYEATGGLDNQPVTADSATAGNPDAINFGYVDDAATGSISGVLFIDEDGDGVADTSESGLSGVDVYVCDAVVANPPCDPSDAEYIGTTQTDAYGHYAFTDLPAGHYELGVNPSDVPSGLTNSVSPGTIDLSEGEKGEANFAYEPDTGTGILSGAVWVDVDGNGVHDSGEAPISGVTISVFDPNGATPGVAIATATTGPDGHWIVTSLTLASDAVGSTDTADLVVRYDASTIPSSLDSSQPTNLPEDDFYYEQINLNTAQENIVGDLDFGFKPNTGVDLGVISGVLYTDMDDDSTYTASTDGEISGVTLNLVDSNGNVIATTTTDAHGAYSFTGLSDGDYQVVVTDHDSVLHDAPINEALPTTITISSGSDVVANQGYAAGTMIGNLVWVDLNENGYADTGEPGLANVEVQCWLDVNGNGTADDPSAVQTAPEPGIDNLVRTVTTSANGEYSCGGLTDGQYIVVVMTDGGQLSGYSDTSANNSSNNAGDNWAKPFTYVVAVNNSNATADFGVVSSSTISGLVYQDEDDNGDYASGGSDVVLEGIEVSACNTATGQCVTVLTGSDGTYSLPVAEGTWQVSVLNPPEGLTVNESPATNPITVTSGNDVEDVDFGYAPPPTTTNPVTLSYFLAESGPGSETVFSWETALEVVTLGFDIYVRRDTGWDKVNDELIQSKTVNSFAVTSYQFTAYDVGGLWFALVDVDGNETLTIKGPFRRDQSYGSQAGDEVLLEESSEWRIESRDAIDGSALNERIRALLDSEERSQR